MFYDEAKIYVKGGDGGNGIVAFRREKYVPEGGPNGGDGGRGGNVIFVTDPGLKTLVDFKYRRHYKADRGQHGQGKGCHGRGADDLVIRVPLGTIVKDSDTGEVLADLVEEGQRYVVAEGGRGGRGNARFATAQNRVPTLAENGEPGQEKWILLELKLLADVGLIGFPNAGKSTLISRISAAKPKIANYPFTTITPNLGVVSWENDSFVVADIPGLIEGAHEGIGLGHEFLRHVERTRLLLHVVDMAGVEGREPLDDIHIINRELKKYDPLLAERPQIIVANKMDVPTAEANLEKVRKAFPEKEIFAISAVTGMGIQELLTAVAKKLPEIKPVEPIVKEEEVKHTAAFKGEEQRFNIDIEDGVYVVSGKEIERHFAMTNFDSEASLRRFQNIIKVMGIEEALRERGAEEGDVVRIKDLEFDLID